MSSFVQFSFVSLLHAADGQEVDVYSFCFFLEGEKTVTSATAVTESTKCLSPDPLTYWLISGRRATLAYGAARVDANIMFTNQNNLICLSSIHTPLAVKFTSLHSNASLNDNSLKFTEEYYQPTANIKPRKHTMNRSY
mmetsp:Transcript_20756/g.60383  ORF Transcript_20756/g.60383 Transcript_20756/m.60383 type:complete len:138 (-) Transcript_20756:962-1375(-)